MRKNWLKYDKIYKINREIYKMNIWNKGIYKRENWELFN